MRFASTILVLTVILTSCSKESEESVETCFEDFYKYDRNVFLTDYFSDNKNSWRFEVDTRYDSLWGCWAQFNKGWIDSNLHCLSFCEVGDWSRARWSDLAFPTEYLAIEIKFTNFFASNGANFSGGVSNNPEFYFSHKGAYALIGRDNRVTEEYVGLDNAIVHILIDRRNDAWYSQVDQSANSGNPGELIDIMKFGTNNNIDSTSVSLLTKTGFGDGSGNLKSEGEIEYLIIYEPLLPCL